VVVPAPELSSIDVAVRDKIGTLEAFRKGWLFGNQATLLAASDRNAIATPASELANSG
jgi:hypothetical protein